MEIPAQHKCVKDLINIITKDAPDAMLIVPRQSTSVTQVAIPIDEKKVTEKHTPEVLLRIGDFVLFRFVFVCFVLFLPQSRQLHNFIFFIHICVPKEAVPVEELASFCLGETRKEASSKETALCYLPNEALSNCFDFLGVINT